MASAAVAAPLFAVEHVGDGPPWLLILAACAGGVLFVAMLVVLQGRGAANHRRDDEKVDPWPWLGARPSTAAPPVAARPPAARPQAAQPPGARPQAARPPAARPQPARPPAARPQAARPAARPQPARPPAAVTPSPGPATPKAGAAASRRGPICQVRWSRRGACFWAVTTEAAGVEHRLARSPRVDWPGQSPPGAHSREAQAALRVLSKKLRDDGWRPMRAKGQDFGAPQWYARRFRLPLAEGADEPARRLDGAAR